MMHLLFREIKKVSSIAQSKESVSLAENIRFDFPCNWIDLLITLQGP